jgi:hypothetical protein
MSLSDHARFAQSNPGEYNVFPPGPLPSALSLRTTKEFRGHIVDSNVEYLPTVPKRTQLLLNAKAALKALKFNGKVNPKVYAFVARKIAGARAVPTPQLRVITSQLNGVIGGSLGLDALTAKGFAVANRAFRAQQGHVTIKWSASILVVDAKGRLTTRHASSEMCC